MMKFKNWIALFSQTGREIIDITKRVDRVPDLIISNNNSGLIENYVDGVEYRWLTTSEEYTTLDILDEVVDDPENTLITLNGWLRIIPPDKCTKYNIYNGHPGLITKYPELKGHNPQYKAWKNIHKYDTVGSVVHKVVEEVDAGEIATESEVSSANITTLFEMFDALRATSLKTWDSFLKEHLYNKV